MYSLKRIAHNQEALIDSFGKSLVVVVYLHNADEETSQLSFSTRKSPCVELYYYYYYYYFLPPPSVGGIGSRQQKQRA